MEPGRTGGFALANAQRGMIGGDGQMIEWRDGNNELDRQAGDRLTLQINLSGIADENSARRMELANQLGTEISSLQQQLSTQSNQTQFEANLLMSLKGMETALERDKQYFQTREKLSEQRVEMVKAIGSIATKCLALGLTAGGSGVVEGVASSIGGSSGLPSAAADLFSAAARAASGGSSSGGAPASESMD